MSRCYECCQSNGTHSDACWTGRELRSRRAASVDTQPRAGDVKQAPLGSGAVAKPDAETPSS